MSDCKYILSINLIGSGFKRKCRRELESKPICSYLRGIFMGFIPKIIEVIVSFAIYDTWIL